MSKRHTGLGPVEGLDLAFGQEAFLGIPFAKPPLADLRFRPPVPFGGWTEVLRATERRPDPVQPTGFASASRHMSEDCLYLNVWTPGTEGQHPVIVWIYGGGFEIGSASPPQVHAARLARRTNSVVVAANYRLGVFGYLDLATIGGEAWHGSRNLGLQDQIAALEWVANNIVDYGGDAGNVTLAGQSAGAISVSCLLASPAGTALARRAILNSCARFTMDMDTRTDMTRAVVDGLGIGSLDDMQSVPVESLRALQSDVQTPDFVERGLPTGRMWGPVVDGDILPREPAKAIADGSAAGVDLLVTATKDEMSFMGDLLGEAFTPAGEATLVADLRAYGVPDAERMVTRFLEVNGGDLVRTRAALLTEASFVRQQALIADAQVGAGGRAYTATFAAEPWGPALGAAHGADLPYIFDTLGDRSTGEAIEESAANVALVDEVGRHWKAFVEEGSPGWDIHVPGDPTSTKVFGSRALI